MTLWTDMLGNPVSPGDFIAFPEAYGRRIIMNIVCCEYYEDGKPVFKKLNRRTGRWINYRPRWNKNHVKVDIPEGISVEQANEIAYEEMPETNRHTRINHRNGWGK